MNLDRSLQSMSADWHGMRKCSMLRYHDKATWNLLHDLRE